MRRVMALVLCGLVLAAVPACRSTSSKPAATVNGVQIPTQDLIDELNAIGNNTDYLNTLQGTVRGSTPGSFDAAFVAQVLLQEVNYSMVHGEYANRKLNPNDECRQQARNSVYLDLGNQNADTGRALFERFVKKYQDVLVNRRLELLALSYDTAGQTCGKPVDGPGYYRTHPDDFTKVCIYAIAVADKATADSVVAQARGGADFQALARDVSIDEQSKANGGDIGCSLPATYKAGVADQLKRATVGAVLDPFALDNGYGVFKVYDRQQLTSDEVQQAAEELASLSVGRNVDIAAWISEARSAATVTIDPRYGTFDKTTFTIKAPTFDVSSSSGSSTSSSPTDAP